MCILADEHLHKSCLDTCGRVGMDMSLCQQGGGRLRERVLRASLSAEVLIGEAERCARPPACGLDHIKGSQIRQRRVIFRASMGW